MNYLSLLLLLPLPMILNRWRGTGTIFNIFGFQLIGNIIYAIYIALLVGLAAALNHSLLPFTTIILNGMYTVYILQNSQFLSSFIFALFGAGLYIFGESFAWGKWVGSLCHPENITDEVKNGKCGKSFPYIHYIANYIQNQDENYKLYCQIALSIKGLIWWTPLFILLGVIDLLSWYLVAINSIILSIGFPIACYIGNMMNIEYRSKYLNLSRGWENQEVVYGLIQFLCLNLSISLTKVF